MNWRFITTAIIGCVFTCGVVVALFWWQPKTVELTYAATKQLVYSGTNRQAFTQTIDIVNSGKYTADEVILRVNYLENSIQRFHVLINSDIHYTKTADAKGVVLSIPTLKPQEKASLTVLVEVSEGTPIDPKILLRAKGVTGQTLDHHKQQFRDTILIALAAIYVGMLVLLLVIKNFFSVKAANTDEQVQAMATTLCLHGFPEKARMYLSHGLDQKNGVEIDLLSAEAIQSDQQARNKIIKVLEAMANEVCIDRESSAIARYNIARILLASDADPSEPLDAALKLDQKAIQHRILTDPLFSQYREKHLA